MKVLNLSLDKRILDPLSGVTRRVFEYGELTEKYTVVVPADRDSRHEISAKTEILSVRGGKAFQLLKIYLLSAWLIKKNKYDLITVQDAYYLGLLGLVLARIYGCALELQVHGWEKFKGLRKRLAKFVLPRADAVRTVSERFKEQLSGEFGVRREAITVVPIYTAVKLRRPASSRPGRTVFLTVSRLVEIKNIPLQIAALKRLLKRGLDLELRIVGSGPEEARLRVLAAGREDRIKFSGWVQELDQIYSGADVFLLSSDREGWGLVVVEAASYGLPVIMTDVGCAGEIVVNQENGLVVPVGDEKALAAAMERYALDPALRERHALALQAKIKTLPSKEETLKLYQQGWQRALKGRDRRL